jgi:putative nucleotidyltransferase with HDIG domain
MSQRISTTTNAVSIPINGLDGLPTLPVVALRIGELVHARTTSVNQVAAVLAGDPGMSAKLLRLVNSPYFGIPGGVSDVARAIPFVGFNTLYQLVLSISVLDTLSSKTGDFDPRQLWLHSLTVGTAARVIAEDVRHGDPDTCFTAGLLHDMGKIALAMLEPERFAASIDDVQRGGIAATRAEEMHGLPSHDALGSKLAKHWKFPASLASPIEHHHGIHRPGVRDRLAPAIRSVTEIVAGADYLSHRCAISTGMAPTAEDGDADAEAAAQLYDHVGVSHAKLDDLYSRTMARLEKSKVFLTLIET